MNNINDDNLFLSKQKSESEQLFTDDDLIAIYNALGFVTMTLAMSNNLLQDNNVMLCVEDNNRSFDTLRCKIESEICRRNIS